MARKSTSPLAAGISRGGQYVVYLLFRAIETALWLIPLPLVAFIGRCIGGLIYFIAWPYRRLAMNNLRIAFERELSVAQRRSIAWRHFKSLGGNFLCGLKLPLMREAEVCKHVSVSGLEHTQSIADSGRPVLYAVCHLSCWELLTQVPSLFVPAGMKPASIFQPLGNPFLNAHVRRRREHLGYVLFDRKEGFNGPMKHLREQQGALGVLVDQHAGDSGVWCPFFDRLASTTSLPALMARRCATALIPISVQDAGLGKWKMEVHPPIDSRQVKITAEGMTAELNIIVERIIREAPENWFWVHNRWKTPKPDFMLSAYKRGIQLPQGYDVAKLQPFEVMLRSPNWLGDACMAFPAVRALRKGRPDLRLSVFTQSNLADLWRSLGIIDEIITKDKGAGLFAAVRKIKATGRHYDAGILFTNSTRSTLEFWLAGIARLVGFKGTLRSSLVEQIAPEQKSELPPEHQALKYLRLAAHCGAAADSAALFAPDEPPHADPRVTIGICAGAEYGPAKRWPLERYAETIKLVSQQCPDVHWQLFGAPGEKAMGEQLSSMITGASHDNLVGKTSLTELVARLRRCKLLLTNDTGTMHLAAALGVPTVSIFGSTEPILTGPLGDHHTIVRHHVPCSPCFKRECPFEHYDCMTLITPERVAQVVIQRL